MFPVVFVSHRRSDIAPVQLSKYLLVRSLYILVIVSFVTICYRRLAFSAVFSMCFILLPLLCNAAFYCCIIAHFSLAALGIIADQDIVMHIFFCIPDIYTRGLLQVSLREKSPYPKQIDITNFSVNSGTIIL